MLPAGTKMRPIGVWTRFGDCACRCGANGRPPLCDTRSFSQIHGESTHSSKGLRRRLHSWTMDGIEHVAHSEIAIGASEWCRDGRSNKRVDRCGDWFWCVAESSCVPCFVIDMRIFQAFGWFNLVFSLLPARVQYVFTSAFYDGHHRHFDAANFSRSVVGFSGFTHNRHLALQALAICNQ
jgi:hypothetical protein